MQRSLDDIPDYDNQQKYPFNKDGGTLLLAMFYVFSRVINECWLAQTVLETHKAVNHQKDSLN